MNRQEPKPRAGLPECPPEVSPAVREVWDYIVAELAAMRTITPADRDALLCLCEAVVIHREASKVLAQTKILVRTARSPNVLRRNPALQVQRDAAGTVRMFAEAFGLTPAARSGIRVGESSRDATDDLLTGG